MVTYSELFQYTLILICLVGTIAVFLNIKEGAVDMLGERLYIESLAFTNEKSSEDKYPYSLPAFKYLSEMTFKKRVAFFVGENGMGKSTLLEAIAVRVGFNPEGGSKNHLFSTKNSHSHLYKSMKLARGPYREKDGFFLRAESVYNLATNIDDLDDGSNEILAAYGDISLHEQSHGESFLAIMKHRCFGRGLYIFDEPEAALSPINQMALLCRMKELVDDDSQFIIATHSPIIMAMPGAEIYLFTEDGIRTTAYQDTDHYLITKQFLNNTDGMLENLFQS